MLVMMRNERYDLDVSSMLFTALFIQEICLVRLRLSMSPLRSSFRSPFHGESKFLETKQKWWDMYS